MNNNIENFKEVIEKSLKNYKVIFEPESQKYYFIVKVCIKDGETKKTRIFYQVVERDPNEDENLFLYCIQKVHSEIHDYLEDDELRNAYFI